MSDVRVEWEYVDSPARHRAHKECGGEVVLHDGRPKCLRCGVIDSNAGWIKRLLMWNWHWCSLDGWPGWHIIGEGHEKHPPFVQLTITSGEGKSSHTIASEWDDLAKGLFYHRDWTDSGIPCVSKNEQYRAGFWFEKIEDRDAFVARFGGCAS